MTAQIQPNPKEERKNITENDRPTGLLVILSKLMEEVLNIKLNNYF